MQPTSDPTRRPPVRPEFPIAALRELTRDVFGITGDISELPSERDRNFLVQSDSCKHVLKIANVHEQRSTLEFQHSLIARIGEQCPDVRVPVVIPSRNGDRLESIPDGNGVAHWIRLLEYLPGRSLSQIRPHSPSLLRQLGRWLGQIDRALLSIQHPAMERELKWDLRQAARIVAERIECVADKSQRALVTKLTARLNACEPRLRSLRQSVIYNDANDNNVLVDEVRGAQQLCGLIDFGDALQSYTIGELAIACAYAMMGREDPFAAASALVAGYHAEFSIPEHELEVLFELIVARLLMSVTIAAEQSLMEPQNEYLVISRHRAWRLLDQLSQTPGHLAWASFRNARGLQPCPKHERITRFLRAQTEFHSVTSPELSVARCCVLDLSVGSPLVSRMEALPTLEAQTELIANCCALADAEVGIGRYNEPRVIYQSERYTGGEGVRTIHIGLDLFMPAGSPVHAPLDGIVHSFADNHFLLDYGPTIVLQHCTDDGIEFFTLYGHLSRPSLDGLTVGQEISAGQQIATLGDESINGGWVPHLHFQLMTDMLEKRGDFPGVAPAIARDVWLSLCPDPNIIVRAPVECDADGANSTSDLAQRRAELIGSVLSLAYDQPLVIVKGRGQYLFDAQGRSYLDCVNNVAHVGHCHPRVNRAASDQAVVLNTNTRYLHGNLTEYARRLIATMPPALNVCFFVCSGSEANELALRLACAHTGGEDVIVLDGAYHGNTSSLVAISPYKFRGRGGFEQPEWVHVVPVPDVYRGPLKSDNPQAGPEYAASLGQAIDAIQARRRKLSCFFVESIPGCAGQIVLPTGYLDRAFAHVRQAGGICIADEVQTGFGRVGTHMWAFQLQDVIPDIVTLGKPIGNGHPMGAVVTTAEIAASFDKGMEYFNTFGGNPVSCAVGLAVLDIVHDEGLQQRARHVGEHFLIRLAELKERFPLIGDVRGAGLFIGVELVRDSQSLEPAAWEANYVVNRMKHQGILLSTDGPHENVLKIKPPLVITRQDADRVCDRLADVFADSCLQRPR